MAQGMVELLLREGADVNEKGAAGWTALLAAASAGKEGAVRVLLAGGARPEEAAEDGKTPLMQVRERGRAAFSC